MTAYPTNVEKGTLERRVRRPGADKNLGYTDIFLSDVQESEVPVLVTK